MITAVSYLAVMHRLCSAHLGVDLERTASRSKLTDHRAVIERFADQWADAERACAYRAILDGRS